MHASMQHGECRRVELCAQAGATKDPQERLRLLRELADFLEEMLRYMQRPPEGKAP